MANRDQQVAKLKEYGFSEYATRVYLALLEVGRADARDASRQSRVPLAKIYAVLRQLQERGLVDVAAESPRKYIPRPFAGYLARLKAEHHERTGALERDIEAASVLFPEPDVDRADGSGHVRHVRGRRNVLDKWREHFRRSRGDVLVLAGEGFADRLPTLLPMFEEFTRRGGRLRILGSPALEQAHATLVDVATMRDKGAIETEHEDASISVFDREVAMIAHLASGEPRDQVEDFAILTDVRPAVGLLADILDAHWERASPLDPSELR